MSRIVSRRRSGKRGVMEGVSGTRVAPSLFLGPWVVDIGDAMGEP
jgi:hypothetical protein